MWILLFIAVLVAGVVLAGCQTTRSRYASAPYQLVRASGPFELRDYPQLTLVETTMSTVNGDNNSFMRLFHFISGSNAANQKIAMTTPVFMAGSGTNSTMAFVLPANMNARDVPRPSDAAIQVREVTAGRFAVFRFRGGRNARNEDRALQQLRAWMKSEALSETAGPVFGYFDPPWTLPFLRRNEVMLRVDDPK